MPLYQFLLLDPQYDNIRVRRYWDPRVPISRPIPLTIFTVIATDTTDESTRQNCKLCQMLKHKNFPKKQQLTRVEY